MNSRILALLVSSFLIFSSNANAALINNNIQYYEVEAEDLRGLRQQIQSKGPLVAGNRYPIHGEYHFKWKPKTREVNQQCQALAPELQLQARLKMPRWISQSQADFGSQQQWLNFIGAAQQYHQQISNIVENNAQRFSDQAKSLNADNCEQLAALIDAKGRAALASANQQVRNYQRKTQSGRSLGLSLSTLYNQ
ncbi:DUF922 domain-containing protein [Alginatibacterium sediminis]|uniref:DUF922 domain-containing protein n=1 Tax=Alginatibacterium sediminis TaxID=2164068 RepID=A0A420EG09_9ALTE|nr:DUF922 domain-containing protein [Alginatibacterium sediminis]RKF19594.1 DUF922 domain-containing protein [Alginatibacterium sediminis]